MKIFEKKSFVKIEKEDIDDAKLSSGDFKNQLTKKRAFVDVLGARLAMKLLFSKKIEAENVYSLYTINSILEELDIADIYFKGIKIDVRLVFNSDEIFIPKSHFEYDLLPDIYIILQLKPDFSGAEFLGFIKPEQINKENQNAKFYFVETNQLNAPEEFKSFLDNFVSADNIDDTLDDSLDVSEKMFLYLVDKEISSKDKAILIKQLSKSISLREKLVEFENFELLSMAAGHNKELIQDGFMDIVGAQQVIDEENNLTHDEFAEVVGLPTKPKMGLDSLLEDKNDVVLESSEVNALESEAELENNNVEKEANKNDNSGVAHAVGGALNVAAAGIGLGGAMLNAGAAQASTQASAISGGAGVLSSGVDAIGHGVDSGINNVSSEIAKSIAKTSSSTNDSDLGLLDNSDNLDGEILNDTSLDDFTDINPQETNIDSLEDLSDLSSDEDSFNNVDEDLIPDDSKESDLFDLDSSMTDSVDSEVGSINEDAGQSEDLFDLEDISGQTDSISDTLDENIENDDLVDLQDLSTVDDADVEEIQDSSSDELVNLSDDLDVSNDISEDEIQNEEELVDLNNLETDIEPLTENEVTEDSIETELLDLNNAENVELQPMDIDNSISDAPVEDELVGFADLESDFVEGDLNSDLNAELVEGDLGTLPDLEVQDLVEPEVEQPEPIQEELQTIDNEPVVDQNIDSEGVDAEVQTLDEIDLNEISDSDNSDETVNLDNFDFGLLNEELEEDLENNDDNLAEDSALVSEPVVEQSENESELDSNVQSEELMAEVDDFYRDVEITGEQDPESIEIESLQESVSTPVENKEDKDLLKVLFEKEHIEEDDQVASGYSHSSLTEDNKKMIVAATLTSVVLASFLIGGIVVSHNHNAAQVPPNVNSQTLSGDPNQQMNPEENPNMPQTGVPQGTQDNMLAGNPNAQNPNDPNSIGAVPNQPSGNGLFSEPVNATISKIAWEVPEDLAYNDSFRRYLQIAGKNLKLNLQNDLLLTNEMAYSNKIVVDLEMSGNGGLTASNITTSSGSKQIDNIVLQSIKETLQYLKMPSSELGGRSIVTTLIIHF